MMITWNYFNSHTMAEKLKIVAQDKKEEKVKIILKDSLTIDNTEAIRKKIIEKLDKYKSVDLELINMQSIDLSGIQLITALKKYCLEKTVDFNIQAALSDELSQLMEYCGITSLLVNKN